MTVSRIVITSPGRQGKYNARRVTVDGIQFDSQSEARHYGELRALEKAGEITGLVVHPRFEILPAFTDGEGRRERATVYEADFAYIDDLGRQVVIEVKGFRTQAWVLKGKLFRYRYPHLILRVVRAK